MSNAQIMLIYIKQDFLFICFIWWIIYLTQNLVYLMDICGITQNKIEKCIHVTLPSKFSKIDGIIF